MEILEFYAFLLRNDILNVISYNHFPVFQIQVIVFLQVLPRMVPLLDQVATNSVFEHRVYLLYIRLASNILCRIIMLLL